MISKKVPELTVIDEKKKSIDFLKQRLSNLSNVKILSSNIENLSIERYDTVILLNVLEHIKEDQKAIEKLMSVLNKDGYLIIQVPKRLTYLYSDYDRMVGHHKRYHKKDIQIICKKLNLNVIDLYYFNPIGAFGWWYNYCFKKKLKNSEEKNETINQLKIYDKYIVPLIDAFDSRYNPFGISLFTIIKK